MFSLQPNLVTGTQQDPLLPKLLKAIRNVSHTNGYIEIAVSFVQPSGINLLFDDLKEALDRGATLRLLTSDYLNITHPQALRRLLLLSQRGAEVKIFECKNNTSFHLKTYIFTQCAEQGIEAGSAFIGSNNISKAALTHAHEWAWRHDWEAPLNSPAAQQFQIVRQAFKELFHLPETHTLTNEWLKAYQQRYSEKLPALSNVVDLTGETLEPPTPYPVQMDALEQLNITRYEGFKRGLIVLATGMGKTFLAAFDAKQMQAQRVLFVAHREEILLQAQSAFNTVLPEKSSGLFKADRKDIDADFLFASVQSLRTEEALETFHPEHFDYVVVDEFHHASAPSYRALLSYFKPKFMLGLTATPERTDQADILSLCDNNLVFERNLVHGINDDILVPITYHGILDEYVNYQEIPWRSGRFNPHDLENAFATRKRAEHIYAHWSQQKQTRTMGFCISKKHADFMAEYFRSKGVRAAAVYSNSTLGRQEALTQLENQQLDVLFSVDLFNEGTDIPSLDTLLMIRPTESKIIFLQQLGRGLRRNEKTNKKAVVVLDFLGNHQSFLNNPAALLGYKDSRKALDEVLKNKGKPELTPGCYINFDVQLLDFWQQLKRRIGASAQEDYEQLSIKLGHRPTATEFFHAGYSLAKVRKQHGSWLQLVAEQENHSEYQALLASHGEFFLDAVETTRLTKSFKPYLYQALVELGGAGQAVPIEALAARSRELMERRPDFLRAELPLSVRNVDGNSTAWVRYWRKNPIHHSCQQDKRSSQAWFVEENGHFRLNFTVEKSLQTAFETYFLELIDLRLAEYSSRPSIAKKMVAEGGYTSED